MSNRHPRDQPTTTNRRSGRANPAAADPEPVDDLPDLLPDIETPGAEDAPAFSPAPDNGDTAPLFDSGGTAPLFDSGGTAKAPRAFPIQTVGGATPIEASGAAAPSPPTGVDPALLVTAPPRGAPNVLIATVSTRDHAALASFTGEASVMLADPSVQGARRRIARWDFSVAEVAESWVGEPGDPRRLELPIAVPEAAPTDRPLRLWVRLIEADGGKRLAAVDLRLEP